MEMPIPASPPPCPELASCSGVVSTRLSFIPFSSQPHPSPLHYEAGGCCGKSGTVGLGHLRAGPGRGCSERPAPLGPGRSWSPGPGHPSQGPLFSVAAVPSARRGGACWERDRPEGCEWQRDDPVRPPPSEWLLWSWGHSVPLILRPRGWES